MGVCIMISQRFASRQLHRGRIGTRGCWVRIQGPVCNLLLICIYLPPLYSKADVVILLKGLREVLRDRSLHDCVVLLGDFNVKFPRRYQNIIGTYAYKLGKQKLWTRDQGPSVAVCCQRLVCSLHVFSAKETADYTHVA